MINNKYIKGITLGEIIISVSILALILVIIIPGFSDMRKKKVVDGAVADVISVINQARSNSMSSIDSNEYGVHFEQDRVIIFTGPSFSALDSGNQEIDIFSPATLSAISLTGGATSVYFNRLTGTPNVSGTITVSAGNMSKTITLSATGIVSSN